MASSNPWNPVQPTAAGLMLARCLSSGVVSQETLDICGKPASCFVRLSEAEEIADLHAEINQINLEAEILQMEKNTADITHPFYLTQKCQALQAMNRHLEAVLKDKRSLRQRLVKPLCQESLPIEAVFHRYAVELLALAVAFIEKLETHLATVRSIPQIPLTLKNLMGEVLDNWRRANVPIFKKGRKEEPGNYRPVSLTSIPGKILEQIMKKSI